MKAHSSSKAIPWQRAAIVRTLSLLLAACVSLSAKGFSQKITLSGRNMTLESAFAAIKKQSGYSFMYNEAWMKQARRLDIDVRNEALETLLDKLFSNQPFTYQIIARTVVLKLRERPLPVANLAVSSAIAQRIHGRVMNEKGEWLPGVSIAVKGTGKGVVTGDNGQFNIEAAPGDILVISMLGYTTQEVPIGSSTDITITLRSVSTGLEQVIVVGYGTQKKENLTGAVSSVKMADVLGSRPVTSTAQALQGAVPGLQITYGTGQPGTSTNLNIRGFPSINGGSPLVLVDNVPVDIDDINPADIESISVLKDAAASSIYGARAAFGVILINTKKGARNKRVQFNYSTNISFTKGSTLPVKPTPLQYVKALKDFGTVTYWGGQDVQKWYNYLLDYQANPGAYPKGAATDQGTTYPLAQTDLYGALFPGGFEQLHNFSFDGGSEKTSYRVSLGYANENGIMVTRNDAYKRYNVNAYLNSAITNKLTATVNVLYKNDDKTSPVNQGTLYYNAVTMGPYVKTGWDTAATGEYLPYSTPDNLVKLEPPQRDFTDNLRLFGKLDLALLKGLTITGEYTFEKSNDNRTIHTESNRYIGAVKLDVGPLNGSSSYYRSNSQTNYQALNLYANYDKRFGEHHFHALAGTNQELSKQAGFNVSRLNVLTSQVPSISTSTGTINGDDSFGEYGVAGYFGRLNYNYREKYLLEMNGRFDGSSRFPAGHRFGFFPSFSAGWIASEERFMQRVKNVVPFVKLRGSWGEIGNQVILKRDGSGDQDYYPAVPGLVTGNAPWINPSTNIPYAGLSAPALVSSSFSWETVRTANIGIDLGLLGERLNTSFDVFNRKTLNMLGPGAELPSSLGAKAPLQNIADLVSKGWELQVDWKDNINDFRYSFGFNLSDNQTTITRYNNAAGLLSQYYEGQKYNEIWGFVTQGYFTVDDFEKGSLNNDLQGGKLLPGIAPYQGVAQNPGDVRYKDLNGDGIINTGNNTLSNPGDRKVIGNATRRLQFGINGSASWKGFDFSFFAIGVGKRDIWLNNQVVFPYQGQFGGIFAHQLDYWTPDNTNAFYPRVYKDGAGNTGASEYTQTKYLSNGAYLRIKNITLGYTVPKWLAGKALVDKVRVFLTGENLFTFDHLPKGLDPEATNLGTGGIYPFIRKYSFGANVSF